MLAFILFDPLYFIMLAPAMLLAFWAQAKVKSTYAKAGQMSVRSGYSGAQAARRVLDENGLHTVDVQMTRGFLSDHFDPRHNVLRLSPDVYQGRSLASVGIAAHEAGHALQKATQYAPMAIRNGLVPMAQTGSGLSIAIFMAGMFLQFFSRQPSDLAQFLMVGGIVLFSAVVLFQLVNLPVEFNASKRALVALRDTGVITMEEQGPVRSVLNAAAWTYVAATLSAVMTLLYLILRSGLLGGSRN